MKLLDYGSVNIDHVYRLAHQVRAGETMASNHYRRSAGGKGFNQAVALAKAGQQVFFAGAIGEDGRFLKEQLEALGVHTEHLRVLAEPTGHAIIQVDEQGQNAIILFGGANRNNPKDVICKTLDEFAPGDYVLVQNEIAGCETILDEAYRRGLRVVLNPSPATKDMRDWPLQKVSWLLLNEVEGADLTGKTDPSDVLDALLMRYPDIRIVLTLGINGSIYADAKKRLPQPIVPSETVDTTGAGDTFTGYFLQAILSGQGVEAALYRASKAAAIAVSRQGAADSIPFMREVEAYH